MTKYGFCGMGIMGVGMANRLVAAGMDVTVYNRTAAKVGEERVRVVSCWS